MQVVSLVLPHYKEMNAAGFCTHRVPSPRSRRCSVKQSSTLPLHGGNAAQVVASWPSGMDSCKELFGNVEVEE